MSLNKPVIAPLLPAVKQLFVDTGCVIGVDNTSESIQNGLQQFYDMEPAEVTQLTSHAREMVEKRWRIEHMTDNHLNAIARVLAEKTPPNNSEG